MGGNKLSPTTKSPAARKIRASRPKVKSGCRTCKLRGVKCDEDKPACQRCISSGRVCEGYGIWGGGGNAYGSRDRAANTASSTTLATYTPCLLGYRVGHQEIMAFDYFRTRTSIKLPSVFNSEFWETLVYQACSREPAVLHALIALGAVHLNKAAQKHNKYPSDISCMNRYERLALQQYNKAIAHLDVHFKSKSKNSLQVALITCMVFICIELLREKSRTAKMHVSNGLKLLSEIQGQQGQYHAANTLILQLEPASVDDHLTEAFRRLNIHSPLFDQSFSMFYVIGQDAMRSSDYEMPEVFETFHQARLHLDGLINRVYHLAIKVDTSFQAYKYIPKKYVQQRASLQASLELWLQKFSMCIPSLAAQGHRRTTFGVPLLRLYYLMTTVMASVCIQPGNEMAYDLHTAEFASIISEAVGLWRLVLHEQYTSPSPQDRDLSKPSFTVDMGFIPPLYYTLLKCRIPSIRRAAINLLLSAPHREGLWDGVLAACIGRRIMEIEEGDLYQDISSGGSNPDSFDSPGLLPTYDIPLILDSARVRDVSVLLPDGIDSKAELTYKCGITKGDGSWEVKTVEIVLLASEISSGVLRG